MKVIYTVDLDPGDCPEVRTRLRIDKDHVGSYVPKAIRDAMAEAIYVAWPDLRYGVNRDTYREPRIGRITMRIEGGKPDTFRG